FWTRVAASSIAASLMIAQLVGPAHAWRYEYEPPPAPVPYEASASANGVGIDALRDVYVVADTVLPDIFVAKIDGATGEEIWSDRLDGGGTGLEHGTAIVVTQDMPPEIYVAGALDAGDALARFTVIRLDPDSGAVLWQTQVTGTGTAQGWA